MNRIYHILLLFTLLLSSQSFAQTSLIENYSLSQYTDADGLPQNSVKKIAADADGFIWFITESGLVRFDGQHFNIFDKFNTSLISGRFYAIQPSLESDAHDKANQRLYAVTDEGDFLRIENGRAVPDSVYFHNNIQSLPFFKMGHISTYVASGLPIYLSDYLSQRHYIVPVFGGHGTFFVCDSSKAEYYNKGKKEASMPFNGKFWDLFVIGGSLYHYDQSGDMTRMSVTGKANYSVSGDILNDPSYDGTKKGIEVFWNNTNDQVFLYLNKNLYMLYEGQNGKMNTSLVIRNFDLTSRNIQSLYYNKSSKSLFMGSITQGLFVVRSQSFQTLTTGGDEMENVFYAQTAYGKSTVLTPKGIVVGKDGHSGLTVQTRLPGMLKENLVDGRGLLTDKNGKHWAKNFNYLNQYDKTAKKRINTWNLGDEIKTIYMAKDGMIWLGLKTRGLYYIDPDKENPEPEFFLLRDLHVISYIESKTTQSLLVGTEHGLYEVNLKTKKAVLITGTQNMFIKSIYASGSSQIWITTRDEGLMLYHKERLVVFPMDKRRFLAPSHCILEDKNGFFWITTNKGLFRIKKTDLLLYADQQLAGKISKDSTEELFYEFHDKRDGFLINEFNGGCQPCALRLSNGYVSLPSLKGLVWFIPEKVITPSLEGKIFLDKVEYDGKTFLGDADTLRLPVDAKRIKFYFSTPYFGHLDNLHFSYALVEYGSYEKKPEWSSVNSNEAGIYFSALNSGKYTLLIRKSNGFGSGNYSVKKIFISVPPLWYETWWARFGFIFIFMAGIYLFFRIRVNKIKGENRRLEAKIARRTDELAASRDEQARQVQIMSRLLTSMTHDIQSPLNFILRTCRSVPKMIEKGEFTEACELTASISESTQNMSTLIKDLLDYMKAYVYGKTMKFETVSLQNIVTDKVAVFKSIICSKNNQVLTDIPQSLTVYTDHQMLSIIVHNLIDNAAKFTRRGIITIYAQQLEDKTHLVFSNNGKPLSDDLLRMFNHGLNLNDAGAKTGLGFFLVKEIAYLINAEVKVTQTETTNFHLIFDNHYK